ncbi:MAG: LysM peptidoglycan-binding domain-containing protein [Dehalococcoidia bacterium]|nr:LysM peptidoglycan-binding domain-containing protein [Dehalococcoidia bacterium]
MTAPVKAYLETETGSQIPFLFNPSSIDMSRSVSWKPQESPGENAPSLTWDRGQAATMKFDLVLDTTDTGSDVTVHTNKLLDLTKVDSQKKRPPWVRLGWGRLSSFKAVITSVTMQFTYFSAAGVPLRARATLNLMQYQDEGRHPLQNPTSGTRSRDRMHLVKPGETLDRIAYGAYGDSTTWRVIAERNKITDPLRLQPGTRLILPEREATPRGR